MNKTYKNFKLQYLKLSDHVLSKPDDMINLNDYTELDSCTLERANKTHICGTPGCIVGFAPEIFKEFSWNGYGTPECKKTVKRGYELIYVIAGFKSQIDYEKAHCEYDSDLGRLFSGGRVFHDSHRIEVKYRRDLVASVNGFKALEKLISKEITKGKI